MKRILILLIYLLLISCQTKTYFEKRSIDAQNGDQLATWQLARMYLYGQQGAPQDEKKAFELYLELAKQDNNLTNESQLTVANMYEKGQGVTQDYKSAFYWYSKAAEKDGIDQIATNSLARMYLNGLGVQQNYKKAFELSSKSSGKGSKWGTVALAEMYANGQGVTKNYRKALELYSKGYKFQCDCMGEGTRRGFQYLNGEGVPIDYTMAYMWFNVDASLEYGGDPSAGKIRDLLAKQMTLAQITKAKQMTDDWLAKNKK